jgi:hypothetical protein
VYCINNRKKINITPLVNFHIQRDFKRRYLLYQVSYLAPVYILNLWTRKKWKDVNFGVIYSIKFTRRNRYGSHLGHICVSVDISIFHATFQGLFCLIWHSEDRASWYILIIKAKEMHYFSNLFDKVLYMFRTFPPCIIRSILTLYTRNRYLSCYFCWRLLVWSWPR